MIAAVRAWLRRHEPVIEPTKSELVTEYVHAGRLGMALAVYRAADADEQHAIIARFAEQPPPDVPHLFRPRRYGSREACEICGARPNDPIHVGPRPGGRRDGADHAHLAAADPRRDPVGVRHAD